MVGTVEKSSLIKLASPVHSVTERAFAVGIVGYMGAGYHAEDIATIGVSVGVLMKVSVRGSDVLRGWVVGQAVAVIPSHSSSASGNTRASREHRTVRFMADSEVRGA